MQPSKPSRALVYELTFSDQAGASCSLYGEKHLNHGHLLRGMTTLYSEVARGGLPVLRGELHFELEHVWPWLRSFRVA